MEVRGIKYIGPFLDGSGYAKASRGNILALHSMGVPITLEHVSFDQPQPDLGKEGKLLRSLIDNDIEYNVIITHMLPHFWDRYREEDKTLVGYTVWETSKLPTEWVENINKAEKVLVSCEWSKGVFEDSGVSIPVGVVPHGISMKNYVDVKPYSISGISESTFVFYSIMQWTERKNPVDLLRAYWYAFQNDEDVALVLKAHGANYDDKEKETLKNKIRLAKRLTTLEKYPKVYLISDLLTDDDIRGLHFRGDCYVSLDRGEGFGLSPFAAGAVGNPIVVTGYGGVTEFAKKDNSSLIDYNLEPVYGMPQSPWYQGDQLWANAHLVHAAELMQDVYDNRENGKIAGKRLQEYIGRNFNWKSIAEKLMWELEQI